MSTKARTPVRNHLIRRWFIPLFLLLLCVVVASAWFLLAPRDENGLPPIVQINSPSSGATLEINTPLTVLASAEGAESYKRAELYSDGALVAVENSTLEGGSNPLIFAQEYTPLTPGRHVLMVRAYISDDKFNDSGIVYVDVVEPSAISQTINVDTIPIADGVLPSVNDISFLQGVPPDQLLASNPDLNGTDPSVPLSPGTNLHIPPRPRNPAPSGGTPPPEPIASAPAAPSALNLTLDCTSTQLTWTDNSADESSFLVYRLAPGDSLLTLIATLPAGTTTYQEALSTLGTYRYQVAAMRGGMEGLSLMNSASTPDLCAPPSGALETVVLSVLSLDTTETYDGIYCYLDINGSGYQRTPEDDFIYLTPESDGVTYNLAQKLPNHGQFLLAVPPDGGPLSFGGECWGRRGPIATAIGLPFTASHPRDDWDGRDLLQTAMEAAGKPVASLTAFAGESLRLHYRLSANIPKARAEAIANQFDLSGLDPTAIRSILAPVIPEPLYGGARLPIITNLRIEHSFRGCDQFQGNARGFCVLGSLPANGPLTILWDLAIRSPLFSETLIDRYIVTLNVPVNAGPLVNNIVIPIPIRRVGSSPIRTSLILPTQDLPCGSRVQVRVDGFIGAMQLESPNAIFWVVTEPCRGPLATVTIRFTTLEVRDVAESDEQIQPAAIDDWLELQGAVAVNGDTRILVNSFTHFDHWWTPVQGIDPSSSIPRPYFMSGLVINPAFARPPEQLWFVRNLEDFPRVSAQPTFQVDIMRGQQTITIGASIFDVDARWPAPLLHPGGRTSTCGNRIELGPRSSTLWSTLRQTIRLGPPWPNNEECQVWVTVVGRVRP